MKKLAVLLLSAFSLMLLNGCASKKGLPIDEEHFPDAAMREYISLRYDEDQNKRLSDEELEKVTEFKPTQNVKDLKGMELFTKLKEVSLFELDIEKLELNENFNLEKLYISDCTIGSDINLTNHLHLKDVKITGSSAGKLSICDTQALANVELFESSFSKVEIINCRNLESLSLYEISEMNELDLDACDNLLFLNVDHCGDLTEFNLGYAPKMYDVHITECSLKELDISGCDILLKLAKIPPEKEDRKKIITREGGADTDWKECTFCYDFEIKLIAE